MLRVREMCSTPKLVPVEAHYSIGKVERYHRPLRRAYEIVTEEHPELNDEDRLQMAVKAVNDTAGPSGLIPTLLVFGAYPRITELDPPNPSVERRATTIRKAMKEVRRIYVIRKVNDALGTRNGPGTTHIHDLRLNDEVIVYCEKEGWKGLYGFLGIDGESCKIDMGDGRVHTSGVEQQEEKLPEVTHEPKPPKIGTSDSPPNTSRIAVELPFTERIPDLLTIDDDYDAEAFLTEKETRDRQLSIELRASGKITTPGPPFQQSRRTEYEAFIKRGVFIPIYKDDPRVKGHRIFKSRMVDEGKREILTQSLTIQRISQRLIICLAAAVRRPKGVRNGSEPHLAIRDITQAYPLAEIADEFPPGTVFMVVLLLYSILELGNHWFNTYYKYYVENLQMETSTYDSYLLISIKESSEFGIVGMQTDDTLILGDDSFIIKEQEEIAKAGFLTKPIQVFNPSESLTFNRCTIAINGDKLVNVEKEDYKKTYIEQRARGAYIAIIYPTAEDVKALNLRLKWQIENLERGLRYILVDLNSAKIYVFVNGSFANNKDLSSQIGFVLAIGSETEGSTGFTFFSNIIHASFIKCKRVTRAVLASELYTIVAGVDMLIFLATTANMVTDKLGFPRLPTVVCTDSLFFYECIIKLGIIKEKRLMIDIIAIRQSYERRELTEIRWIGGNHNPANAITKATPNKALQQLINTNKLTVKVEGWIQRLTGADSA
ncbi:hypothetical protein DL98DRAFT_615736 [Cadophora sp. DSE1049]|nr:hypothetical protein DL98DRAFT_615736 [Cadophora sp. DSE1049]